jgi:hypothetical protein
MQRILFGRAPAQVNGLKAAIVGRDQVTQARKDFLLQGIAFFFINH